MHLTKRSVLGGALLLSTGVNVRAQASMFKVTIARKYKSKTCTSGYLGVNGQIVAYTLELPWLGNEPLISAIPDGVYAGIVRYDHADAWRIELKNVPGRGNIQIHTGNTPDNTEGCILIGARLGTDLCSVTGSKKAYEALRTAFYGSPNPISTPDKAITVTVES